MKWKFTMGFLMVVGAVCLCLTIPNEIKAEVPVRSFTKIQGEKKALIELIRKWEAKYNVLFTYDRRIVESVEVEVPDNEVENIDKALDFALNQTELKYTILESRYVILYKNDREGIESLENMIQHLSKIIDSEKKTMAKKVGETVDRLYTHSALDIYNKRLVINVSGTITNQAGEPLIGVNVLVKGTDKGTATDFDGKFSLEDIDEEAILVVSYIGYQTQEVALDGDRSITVTLLEDSQTLDEVVVVGYGVQKRSDVTGSVASVDGDEIIKTPNSNITNSLAGRLPGLVAVNGNGKPGSGSRISIRGTSTFGDNSALIVVDGVVRSLEQIDPNEIESISVLKDASATAVYGSRAANGVILITTKRGREGKPSFQYNGFAGLQQPTKYPEVMNAYEYASTKNIAAQNAGKPLPYTDAELMNIENGRVPTTDWYQATLKENSAQNQHNLSVSGGAKTINYFLSAGYLNQQGMYDNINFEKYSVRSNLDSDINENFRISLDLDASTRNYNESGFSAERIFDDIIAGYPLDLAYNPDGTIFYTREQHPVEEIKTGYNKNKVNLLQSTLTAKYQLPFIKGMSISGMLSLGKEYTKAKHYNVPVFMNRQDENGNTLEIYPFGGFNGRVALREGYDEYNTTTANVRMDYERSFGKNEIGGLILFEQLDAKASNFYGFRTNFPAVGLDELFYGGQSEKDADGGSFNDGRRSMVSRLNYARDNKYLLQVSLRIDGSVAFPESNKYGFFPSLSLGWLLSEEPFLKDISIIDRLKVRGSFGQVGNDRNVYLGRRPTFQYRQVFNPSGTIITGNQTSSSIVPGILPNPNVTWETASISNIGIDASFWNGIMQVELDLFYKRTSDILLNRIRSIPETLGAQLPAENYAVVDNKGIELTVNHQKSIGDLTYFVKVNGSFSNNKVVTLDEPANIPDYLLQTGRPLGFLTGYKFLGFFQSNKEVEEYFPQFNGGQKAGDVKYADINGDQKVDANDLTIISLNNSTPRVMGGLQLGGSYKGFDLSVLFQAATRVNILLDGMARDFFVGGSRNNFNNLLDYWSQDNPNASYPRPWEGYHPNNSLTSDLYLRDASYLRLKSIDFGYTVQSEVVEKFRVSNLRIYFSGFNILVLDKLNMFDPEVETGRGTYYPQQRTLNLGINLSF